MTIYELHLAFETQLDKISSHHYAEIPTAQKDYFLNLGAERFIKQRYNGNNQYKTGFEESQKRVDDLSNIVVTAFLQPQGVGFTQSRYSNTVLYNVPQDYWFAVMERVQVTTNNCPNTYFTGVKAEQHNRVNSKLVNPFKRPKRDKVFRTMLLGANNLPIPQQVNQTPVIELYHDPETEVGNYQLTYVQQFLRLRGLDSINPALANFPAQPTDVQNIQNFPYTYTTLNPANLPAAFNQVPNWRFVEYWFNNQSHNEIVNLAVQSALEVLESNRIQTHVQQVQAME